MSTFSVHARILFIHFFRCRSFIVHSSDDFKTMNTVCFQLSTTTDQRYMILKIRTALKIQQARQSILCESGTVSLN